MAFRFETANERWKWFKRFAAGEFEIGPQDNQGYFSPEEIGASLENIYQDAQNDFNTLKRQMFNLSSLIAGEKSKDLSQTLDRSNDLELELKNLDYEGDIEYAINELNQQMGQDLQWSAEYNNEPYTIENSTLQPKHWMELSNIVLHNAEHIKTLIDNWLPPQDQIVWWPQGFSAEPISAQEARDQFSGMLSAIVEFCSKTIENDGITPMIYDMDKDNFFDFLNNTTDVLRIFPVVNTDFKIVDKNGNEIGEQNDV